VNVLVNTSIRKLIVYHSVEHLPYRFLSKLLNVKQIEIQIQMWTAGGEINRNRDSFMPADIDDHEPSIKSVCVDVEDYVDDLLNVSDHGRYTWAC
jgi:hypothetical protein